MPTEHNDYGVKIVSHGMVAGKTVSEWTQEWFTWAIQSPTNVTPLTSGSAGDGSGGFDAGKMFFIGGFDTSHGPLDVTIRAGEPILVPLLNFVDTLDTKPIENKLVSDFVKGSVAFLRLLTDSHFTTLTPTLSERISSREVLRRRTRGRRILVLLRALNWRRRKGPVFGL